MIDLQRDTRFYKLQSEFSKYSDYKNEKCDKALNALEMCTLELPEYNIIEAICSSYHFNDLTIRVFAPVNIDNVVKLKDYICNTHFKILGVISYRCISLSQLINNYSYADDPVERMLCHMYVSSNRNNFHDDCLNMIEINYKIMKREHELFTLYDDLINEKNKSKKKFNFSLNFQLISAISVLVLSIICGVMLLMFDQPGISFLILLFTTYALNVILSKD